MEQLLAVGLGIASSAILSLVKRLTGIADGKIGPIVKPVQPLLVAAIAAGLPILASKIGISVGLTDAEAIASAPTAALAGILARELAIRLKPKAAEGL